MYHIMKNLIFVFIVLINILSCQEKSNSEEANAIVPEILKAMGGADQYDKTHFIKWDFAKRTLYWDKWTGNVRVESPGENLVILVNINTLKGKAFENGSLITDEEKTKALLTKAKNWWINDSFWLVMPWKLQDPGAMLTYVKTAKLPNGKMADVLQLTFDNVGVTPDNKYLLYVDKEDHLIKQWAYFENFNDPEPSFTRPWDNYQKAGNILLSFDRSDFGPTNVEVKQEMGAEIFTKL